MQYSSNPFPVKRHSLTTLITVGMASLSLTSLSVTSLSLASLCLGTGLMMAPAQAAPSAQLSAVNSVPPTLATQAPFAPEVRLQAVPGNNNFLGLAGLAVFGLAASMYRRPKA